MRRPLPVSATLSGSRSCRKAEENKRRRKHRLVRAHMLLPDGTYEKPDKRGKVLVDSQEVFCKEAEETAKQLAKDKAASTEGRTFIPRESPE